MIFHETTLNDAWLLDLERRGDQRGFFARTMCVDEFAAHGMDTEFLQQNLSVSAERGTLRGMHFQHMPYAEAKLIRCPRGALVDIIIDLRPESPSFEKWEAFELNEDNKRQLYVPKGFAHGFQTLTDDVEVSYLVAGKYAPTHESGVRHDDPAFNIVWPLPVTVMSDKDKNWPVWVSPARTAEPCCRSAPGRRAPVELRRPYRRSSVSA
jgi:dTDP-4-dehydrorhamnose 3,5-epimerase